MSSRHSALQVFTEELEKRGVSIERTGRMDLAELIGKIVTVQLGPGLADLRSELVAEFKKQGLLTEDADAAADLFLEMARKEELK